jgi:uncharacterized repeat protein (TIGR03803 family)
VVFRVNTDGGGFTNLYSFTALSQLDATNLDGAFPSAELVSSGNSLYGTTPYGGPAGNGTLFKVNIDGLGFEVLHSFTTISNGNSDGGKPLAGLTLSGSTLYGVASEGGNSGSGTIFKVSTAGSGFTTLYSFSGGSDGYQPLASLTLSNNVLYGTTVGGGLGGGTIFRVNTDGTSFTNLHSLVFRTDGEAPQTRLVLSGDAIYGTASSGGSAFVGTVFSLTFGAPRLLITRSASNVILAWPAAFSGFVLQSATSLVATTWTTNPPAPVVVNGQNIVTNPISGKQKYYRLSQ